MSAALFGLAPGLEALLQEVCGERAVPEREHDQVRALLSQPEAEWPLCCRGDCRPCVLEHTGVAREILTRWRNP